MNEHFISSQTSPNQYIYVDDDGDVWFTISEIDVEQNLWCIVDYFEKILFQGTLEACKNKLNTHYMKPFMI